jgi:hypothetical protein
MWSWALRAGIFEVVAAAAEVEDLAYGALWFPNMPEAFARARTLLEVTSRITAATGSPDLDVARRLRYRAAHHRSRRNIPPVSFRAEDRTLAVGEANAESVVRCRHALAAVGGRLAATDVPGQEAHV